MKLNDLSKAIMALSRQLIEANFYFCFSKNGKIYFLFASPVRMLHMSCMHPKDFPVLNWLHWDGSDLSLPPLAFNDAAYLRKTW